MYCSNKECDYNTLHTSDNFCFMCGSKTKKEAICCQIGFIPPQKYCGICGKSKEDIELEISKKNLK